MTPVLWLYGPPCVGKSTVGYQIFTTVWGSGTKAAYVDLAQIGFHSGGVDHRLRAANLAAMWPGFLADGARCVVMTGQAGPVADYVDGLPGAHLTLCGLHASRDVLTERFLLRGKGAGARLPGDLLLGRPDAELRLLAAEVEDTDFGGLRVDTDGRSAAEVAAHVLDVTGWPTASAP